MPNYIVIFGISFNEYKYNIHSRSTLLDAANSNMLFHKNNGSGSKLQLKPLVFNNGLDLPKSINSCVRHAIYCLFSYQCILSIPSDPLLVRIKQLYNKMVNDFWNSLPGFPSNSISVLKNTPSFHIHTPYCHEFAACYGIEPMSESHQILVTKSFSAMQNAENYVLNLPEFKKFKKRNTCDPFVVICYSSGQCKVFLFSELDKELTRGKTQLFGENIGMTTDSWTNQSLILKNAAEIHRNTTNCNNIYIFCDPTGRFYIQPPQYAGLLPLFNRYKAFFNLFSIFGADPILNIKSEFDTNNTPEQVFQITLQNKLIKLNKIQTKQEHFIGKIDINLSFFKRKTSTTIDRVTRGLKLGNMNITWLPNNHTLTFEQIYELLLNKTENSTNSTAYDLSYAETTNWNTLLVFVVLVLFAIMLGVTLIHNSAESNPLTF